MYSMVLAGYFPTPILKTVTPGFDLAANIDKIAVLIIGLSLLPIAWTMCKERQAGRQRKAAL